MKVNTQNYMNIIPAILTNSHDEFRQQFTALAAMFDRVQIDIADGVFVPNKTLSIYEVVDLLNETSITHSPQIDFHLMVQDPSTYLNVLNDAQLPINSVFIHLPILTKLQKNSYELSNLSFSCGVVLNPEDEVENDLTFIKSFSKLQIMTVHPGFQGGAFLSRMLEKIHTLKAGGYEGEIYLDGGINNETLREIVKQEDRPNFVCVGSYFTHHLNSLEKQLQVLHEIIG